MKSTIWTIILCLLLVAGIALYANHTTKRITDQYLITVSQIEAYVKDRDMEGAARLAKPLKEQWLSDCQSLQFIAFHQDTNKVDSYLYMLEAGFETKNDVVTLWALHELTESLENIYQREAIALVNIF